MNTSEFASAGLTAGQLNAIVKKLGGHEMALRFLRNELIVSESPKPSILEMIGEVTISATTSKFVARDKFVVNTDDDAPVKISHVWDNFQNWFLDKVEKPIAKQTLQYGKLRKSSVDTPIIDELGGEAKAETTLTEMFSLMKKQKNGETGALLINGCANIFYIKDRCGVLRAVRVPWGDDGWNLSAIEVSNPNTWNAGRQVFSRKPLET